MHPVTVATIVLEMDASDCAIGGVLSQLVNEQENVGACCSRTVKTRKGLPM